MDTTIPKDLKEQAIYHTVLADMHRLHALLLNLRTLDAPDTAESLRQHFTREQSIVLGRLNEWRGRRPDLYRRAQTAFAQQVQAPEPGAAHD